MELYRAPIVKLVLPFIAGILAGYYLHVPLVTIASILAILLLLLFGFVIAKPRMQTRLSLSPFTGLAIYTALFFCGQLAIHFNSPTNFDNHLANVKKQHTFLVRLLENPEEKNKTYSALAQTEWGQNGKTNTKVFGKILVYFSKEGYDTILSYGDYVLINGNIQTPQPPLNPAEFDYKLWLENQNIYYQSFLKPGQYKKTQERGANPLYQAAFAARTYFDKILHHYLSDSITYGVASALVLGQRNYLNDDIEDAYARTGTIHILAVSGLHVGAIYLLLGGLLVFFNRNKKLKLLRTLIILAGLWGYALLTGLSPSVTRAAIMFSFIVIGEAIGRKTNLFNSLAASALFILCMDAKAIFSIGFQLSYLAVAGIGLLYQPLYALITFHYKIVTYLWQLVCLSLAAQIATFALGIFYFHQFPNYFLLSNIIIVPLAMLAVYTGIALFILSPIPILAGVVAKGLHLLLFTSNSVATGIESWPYSYSSGLYLSFWGMVLVYIAIIAIGIYLVTKKYNTLVVAVSCSIILMGLVLYREYSTSKIKEFTVYTLPGGQKAVSYIKKNKAWLWTDPSITTESKIYRQKIAPHFIDANVQKVEFETGDSLLANNFGIYGGRFIALHGLKVLWLEDNKILSSLKSTEWDVVITGSKFKPDIEALKQTLHYKQLVSTHPYPKYETEQIHNTALQGAYSIKF